MGKARRSERFFFLNKRQYNLRLPFVPAMHTDSMPRDTETIWRPGGKFQDSGKHAISDIIEPTPVAISFQVLY